MSLFPHSSHTLKAQASSCGKRIEQQLQSLTNAPTCHMQAARGCRSVSVCGNFHCDYSENPHTLCRRNLRRAAQM